MHIKQVIIQGFRSYKEQTIVGPCDPGHNVIVGRNGSGKSNFLQAIQFVLSDEYAHLGSNAQSLLHESLGPRVISAYVEIIFDNFDRRLPIERNEVSLRRVIGSKKDQYFLSGKLVNRNEVMNLLESAGFSKCNPYYIVKQGKINEMAMASDSRRLKLLQDIAGTRVYDSKRNESNSLLKETQGKIVKIEDLLITLAEQLKNLDGEKEELKEYNRLDKIRRCLEYIIYDRELKSLKEKLEEFEETRHACNVVQAELEADAKTAEEAARSAAKKLKELKREARAEKDQLDRLNADHQQLLKEKMKLRLTIQDLKIEVSGDCKAKEKAEEELNALRVKIKKSEQDMEKIRPEYEIVKQREQEYSRELAMNERKRKELYVKAGRVTLFKTKEERNKWIKSELDQLRGHIVEKETYRAAIAEDLKVDNDKYADLEKKIAEPAKDVKDHMKSIEERSKNYKELILQKNQCQARIKDLVLEQRQNELKEDMTKQDQLLRRVVGKSTLNAIDSVRKVLNTFRERGDSEDELQSYYGLLVDTFQCGEALHTAVEVSAGNRLFYHVVESNVLASKILSEMNKQRLPGVADFMPLDRLLVRRVDYPKNSDAIALISQLNYDPKYDRAIRFVFGRTLIARNLGTAVALARSSGLDCVTLEGDQVSPRGMITGGHFNAKHSRLNIYKLRTKLKTIKTLNEEIMRLTRLNKEAFTKRVQLEMEKNKLEIELTNNYMRRMEELIQALQEMSMGNRGRQLELSEAHLEEVKTNLAKINSDIALQNQKITEAAENQKAAMLYLDKYKFAEKRAKERLEEDLQSLEMIGIRLNTIHRNIDEITRKIMELGPLPNSASIAKYGKLSTKQILNEIEKIHNQLKEYSDVNQKALDQYSTMTDEEKKLRERKLELDRGYEKIKELMTVLEQHKYNAIEFTYKQVSKYFSEVFQKLVPSGRGELVMQTSHDEEENDRAVAESAICDSFVGVGIRVSFGNSESMMQEMKQLSGGQKSVVALALIFAIQKCDLAPFYIFDEIDAALDAEHRRAVAGVIHELSSTVQFITTTFRPELIEHAHKHYGVTVRNKVSYIECVTRKRALEFVQDAAEDSEN
ncbi:structural maintenance of chromosomes protein 3-like [Neodiprion pinetum]|uniref:structural maintenance of chromosomes protein 3-like n=1 Tax=Neodiprion pinetum TaxID=441929 RepID=UPI00371367AB